MLLIRGRLVGPGKIVAIKHVKQNDVTLFCFSILDSVVLRATLRECYSRVRSVLQLSNDSFPCGGGILQLPQLV